MPQDTESDYDMATYEKTAPAVVASLLAMAKAVSASGLEKSLTELIKIRVSQINACAFCLHLHLDIARKANVHPDKIDLLATWREVSLFSPRERAALAWAEALTRMAQHDVDDTIYATLCQQFSVSEIAFLTAAIGNINAWNRIAGGLRFPPGAQRTAIALNETTR